MAVTPVGAPATKKIKRVLGVRGSVADAARKQNGGSTQCIRVYTAILSPENIQQRLKALEIA